MKCLNGRWLRTLNLETHSLGIIDNKVQLLVSCHVTGKLSVVLRDRKQKPERVDDSKP